MNIWVSHSLLGLVLHRLCCYIYMSFKISTANNRHCFQPVSDSRLFFSLQKSRWHLLSKCPSFPPHLHDINHWWPQYYSITDGNGGYFVSMSWKWPTGQYCGWWRWVLRYCRGGARPPQDRKTIVYTSWCQQIIVSSSSCCQDTEMFTIRNF